MPFSKCYYHLIWATKHRQPLLTPSCEALVIATIRRVAEDLNSKIWAINGAADHIHIAVSIPPHLAVAQWVKRCKGASSHIVNQSMALEEKFAWQSGYGVLTFGQKTLPYVVDYITRQKTHHAEGRLEAYLEQIDED